MCVKKMRSNHGLHLQAEFLIISQHWQRANTAFMHSGCSGSEGNNTQSFGVEAVFLFRCLSRAAWYQVSAKFGANASAVAADAARSPSSPSFSCHLVVATQFTQGVLGETRGPSSGTNQTWREPKHIWSVWTRPQARSHQDNLRPRPQLWWSPEGCGGRLGCPDT